MGGAKEGGRGLRGGQGIGIWVWLGVGVGGHDQGVVEHGQGVAGRGQGVARHSPPSPGVDVAAAKRAEEERMLQDTRLWLDSGQLRDCPHPATGASALHVAAAKGYIEVMR